VTPLATRREGATGAENIAKLLEAMRAKTGKDRSAYFVCVLRWRAQGEC
jgi:inosine/xanthosine triphosphate pyrophosphatase family protein